MKLASLKSGRDGTLIVVDSKLQRYVVAEGIAETLQSALDGWDECQTRLLELAEGLEQGSLQGQLFDPSLCASPLPRAYQWADGSAYVNHMELVRKARNAEMPESFWKDPLMYQGGSDSFLSPTEDICLAEESWGIDFEAEVAVITNDVPMGIDPETAKAHIQLVMLVNDISLRNVIADELNKGFGFFQSKPSSAFSPVAVTPSSLGSAWEDGKLHLPVRATLNGKLVGQPNAGIDMTFDFGQLIAHAAKTRSLCAGTIIGSGTVSNVDKSRGSCCLAEIRMIETIIDGEAKTPFMRHGDRIQIEAYNALGESVFGQIDQYLTK